jgi:DNA-binding LacI/PurR family transcriptional regulator
LGSGKTTSFDIAHRAGVSQATVSRALRDSPLVSPETRKKVQRIARELNYQVDRRAAGLRSQHSQTLALLLFEDPTSDASHINPFFLSILGNIMRAAARRDYDVLVSFQQLSSNWHHDYELSNRADGIILLGYGDYVDFIAKLAGPLKDQAHFIIWGASAPSGHTVACDNHSGGRMAAQHLLDLGRRRIAFIGNTGESAPEFRARHGGFVQALGETGITPDPALQVDADNLETAGYAATGRLLDSGAEFDALFAASDLIAIGAMRYLNKAGISVPDEVSVVGFDDIPASDYFSPSLTTIRQDTEQAAEVLVENLLCMIAQQPVEDRLLVPSLVVRGSCGGRTD